MHASKYEDTTVLSRPFRPSFLPSYTSVCTHPGRSVWRGGAVWRVWREGGREPWCAAGVVDLFESVSH